MVLKSGAFISTILSWISFIIDLHRNLIEGYLPTISIIKAIVAAGVDKFNASYYLLGGQIDLDKISNF